LRNECSNAAHCFNNEKPALIGSRNPGSSVISLGSLFRFAWFADQKFFMWAKATRLVWMQIVVRHEGVHMQDTHTRVRKPQFKAIRFNAIRFNAVRLFPIALIVMFGLNACPQTAKPTESRKPFGGQAQAVPGIVEAEAFDEGTGIQTFHKVKPVSGDATSRNAGVVGDPDATGQLALTGIEKDDWFEYSLVIARAGQYDLKYHLKAPTKSGVQLSLDGAPIGTADGTYVIPYLGSTNWATIKQNGVTLPAGPHILRATFSETLFALDSFEFVEVGGAPTVNSIKINPPGPFLGVPVNSEVALGADLDGSGNFDQSVTWSVTPATASLGLKNGKHVFSSSLPGDFKVKAISSNPAKFATVDLKVVNLGPQDAAAIGKWSAILDWKGRTDQHVAAHAALLPNGKVISWGAEGDNIIQIPSFVWDTANPDLNQIQTKIITPANLFCAGHSLLPDGTLLVTGGNIVPPKGIRDTTLFNAATSSWVSGPKMNKGRWYPSTLLLSSGDVLIANGRDENGLENTIPDVWQTNLSTPNLATLRPLTGASRESAYFPMLIQASNGRVLKAGPEPKWASLDTAGTGGWTDITITGKAFDRQYGNSVVFKPGKILQIGGSNGTNPATNDASIVDVDTATITPSGPMSIGRRQHNSTILPNGEVLVTGGTSGGLFNDVSNSVLYPEIWSEKNGGTFKRLAPMQVSRVYHSTALLLPDATILSAGGGGACEGGTYPNGCSHDNAEVFYPPYLFKTDGTGAFATRPVISTFPTSIAYGAGFNITTDSTDVARVTLVKLSSVTHSQNFDQRFLELTKTVTGTSVSVTAPSSNISAPPGYYLLFVLNSNGVPSVGKILKLN
jgi:Domain of unknown function (DUF1929)/Carbohydrate binding module (family 6)